MKIIFTTDLSYYSKDYECNVDKAVSLAEACGMYAVIVAENDEEYEYIERFEIVKRTYSYDDAMTVYKKLGGEI